MIAIVNYGVGNLRSVEKAFAAAGEEARVTSERDTILAATHVVLPGVGAFGECARRLREANLEEVILEVAARGKPILGLCVGLQLLFEEGHEFGIHRGLGLLRGRITRFPENGLRVPQIGWNQIENLIAHPLFTDIAEGSYFYFVHSYRIETEDPSLVMATTEYGITFPSICGKEKIFGVQFHPEKSQQMGLRLLANFAAL